MLSFDLRSLTEHAVTVDDTLSADDPVWLEGDPRPSRPIRVKGRLSPAGPGRFYWHGTIDGDVELLCRRCLGEASGHVAGEAHLIYAETEAEGVEDDPDVFLLDDRSSELDLRPAIREQWLLNVPGYALCRDDCKGLCPTCGAELNLGDCACASTAADPRWESLHRVRDGQR
ncbi:MAG: YceD family protein [Gemmatimonadales bacterium]